MKIQPLLFSVLLLFTTCDTKTVTETETLSRIRSSQSNGITHKADTADALNSSAQPASSQSGAFSGTFVYQEKDPAENHTLVIPAEDDRQLPSYFGSESGSGEGIFFYGVGITNLEMDAKGNFSFSIGERTLYGEPFTNLNRKPASESGFSRDELHYTGKFVSGGVELICRSANQSCWTDTLFMKRQ